MFSPAPMPMNCTGVVVSPGQHHDKSDFASEWNDGTDDTDSEYEWDPVDPYLPQEMREKSQHDLSPGVGHKSLKAILHSVMNDHTLNVRHKSLKAIQHSVMNDQHDLSPGVRHKSLKAILHNVKDVNYEGPSPTLFAHTKDTDAVSVYISKLSTAHSSPGSPKADSKKAQNSGGAKLESKSLGKGGKGKKAQNSGGAKLESKSLEKGGKAAHAALASSFFAPSFASSSVSSTFTSSSFSSFS